MSQIGAERFLEPRFTTDPELGDTGRLELPPTRKLPDFRDPAAPSVLVNSSEPLVLLSHRRIRVLSNYWHAGWHAALPTTWMRAEAFERLSHVAERLPQRLGLAVFDAWRPLALQAELWEAAYGVPGLPEGYVAEPVTDPAAPPPHLTGGVVDLTLTLDGTPLALGTGFDDFTDLAAAGSLEATPGLSRELRRVLYHAMRGGGFVVLHCEWWHYEFGTRRWAAITGNEPRYGPATPPDVG